MASERATSNPMTAAQAKNAEIARLFDLFERLAARRPRVLADAAEEFASLTRSHAENNTARIGARRHTLATPIAKSRCLLDSTDINEEALAFPLAEEYPFTFKLMIYKLYEVDEWADKVRDVLARSQNEYKPLGESPIIRVGKQKGNDAQVVARLKAESPSINAANKGKRRLRRHSLNTKASSTVLSPIHASFPAIAETSFEADSGRVVKKRCVGRRKSLSGPLRGGQWVYDAAVAALETVNAAIENVAPVKRKRFESLKTTSGRKSPYPIGVSRARVASIEGSPLDGVPKRGLGRKRAVTIAGVNIAGETAQMKAKRPFPM